MVKKITCALFALLLFGCEIPSNNVFLTGTHLTLGLYIPVNGSVYGLQMVDYLSGTMVKTPSNENFQVDHNTSITNSYLKCVELLENKRTVIK